MRPHRARASEAVGRQMRIRARQRGAGSVGRGPAPASEARERRLGTHARHPPPPTERQRVNYAVEPTRACLIAGGVNDS